MEKRLKIASIVLGERRRKILGDLKGLAHSIKTVGLLQAIGVTKDGNKLLFGERRLRAVRLNGDDEIDCRILDIQNILDAEHAENEYRLNLAPSEKHALAAALREEAKKHERRGGDRRSEKAKNQTHQIGAFDSDPQQCRTDAHIAHKAGFSSATEMNRVAKVIEKGAPELIEAMDQGMPASAAAVLAGKSQEQQVQYLDKHRDENGHITPPRVRRSAAAAWVEKMDELVRRVLGVKDQFGTARQMFDSPLWATATDAEKEQVVIRTAAAAGHLSKLAAQMKETCR